MEYNLNSLELGFLRFQPIGSRNLDFVEGLIKANDPAYSPFAEFYAREHLLQIANLEADPVCIRLEGAEVGQVVWMEHDRVPFEVEFVAGDFERLLICAATDFWKRIESDYFNWDYRKVDHQQREDRLHNEIMEIITEIEPGARASRFWRIYIYY
jgi:hypothetical protein